MGKEKKRKGNSKINDQIKKSIYNWIIHHPKVVQSPIFNDSLKVNIDGHTRQIFFPKLLLHMSVREFRNSLVSVPEDGGLKEEMDAETNIIISDYTLSSLLSPQLKKCQHDTRSCVIANVSYLPKLHILHYYHGMIGV